MFESELEARAGCPTPGCPTTTDATVSNSESTSIISRNAGIVSQRKKLCKLIQFQKEIDFSCAIDTRLTVDVGINVNVDFILVDIEQDIGAFDVEMTVYN